MRISKQRLLDGFSDCPLNDEIDRCFSSITILDGKRNLEKIHIYFQTICDGKRELSPIIIDGQNETDESNCQYWQCNNTYSRCDRYWLCSDGSDEVNCQDSICPICYHSCVFRNDTSQISCLPLNHADNNIDDCLGGTDEPHKYYFHFVHLHNNL